MPKFIGEIGEKRLLTEKDMAGLYYVTNIIASAFEKNNFICIGLGRSPALLIDFMQHVFKLEAYHLPLSVDMDRTAYQNKFKKINQTGKIKKFLNQHISFKAAQKKKIVLIDYVDTGYSLLSVKKLVQNYYDKKDGDIFIAPITENETKDKDDTSFLERKDSVLKTFDSNLKASHRLLKVLKASIDKEYFAKYKRTSEKTIAQGGEAILNKGAMDRVEKIIKIALKHMAGDGGIERLKKLLSESKYLQKRKHPGRNLQSVFNKVPYDGRFMSDQRVPQKRFFLDRYRKKSAEYYGIPASQMGYSWNSIKKIIPKDVPGFVYLAVVMIIACFLVYSLPDKK